MGPVLLGGESLAPEVARGEYFRFPVTPAPRRRDRPTARVSYPDTYMNRRFILISALSAVALLAQDKKADAIKAADKAWADATVKNDRAALGKLLADDLTYTHSNGDTDTKQAFIENLSNGKRKYTKLQHEGMEVRVYGNTAVLSATAQIETLQGGKAGPAHLRFIHVWVQKGGQWQLVAHQSLRLPN